MSTDSPAVIAPMAIYRRLLSFARPHWGVFIIASIGMAFYAATDTGFAWLVKQLLATIQAPVGAEDPGADLIRRWLPLGIMVLFLVRGAAEFATTYSLGWIGRQVIKGIRALVFDRFLHLPTRYYDAASTGTLLSSLTWFRCLFVELRTVCRLCR